MVKLKIGTKLFLSYIILLFITFTATAAAFDFLSERYLIKQARQELRSEGQRLAGLLTNTALASSKVEERVIKRKELKLAGRLIDAKVIVLNANKRIVYTNLAADKKAVLRKIREDNLRRKGYVAERTPILRADGEIMGQVILLTKVEDINGLNKLMRRTQFLSFMIAGFIALTIASVFGNSLTRPIRLLMKRMKGFSLQDLQGNVSIHTGDEIEELALCFDEMAGKLKRYDQQQRRFLQDTSHELKTPLMSIQGYAEAIKEGIVEGEEVQESLEIIIQESQRLKKTVEEIIYLTKLENAEETFQLEEGNLAVIMDDVLKRIKPLADKGHINVEILSSLNYEGTFDEERLKRALINVLGNCIRYANAHVTVRAAAFPGEIRIQVADDGPGFKEGEEARIFDRFYKGEGGGTGIGLAITKAIIEGHGGKVSAFNHKPSGAVFEITLPIIKAAGN